MPNFTPQKVSYGSSNDYLFEPTTNATPGNINAVHICPFQPLIAPSVGTSTPYPNTAFTIPYDGYYRYDYCISFPAPSSSPSTGSVAVYATNDGFIINGTQSNFPMTSIDFNGTAVYNCSGIIPQKLNAGTLLVFAHTDATGVSYTTGTIQMTYTYLGNNTM